MNFPTSKEVSESLFHLRQWMRRENITDSDVRLQVWPNGSWAVHHGSSDYDQDHAGYWGASIITAGDPKSTLVETADDLIDQAKDHAADNQEEV